MLIKNLELNGIELDVAVIMEGQTPKQVKSEIGWPKFTAGDGYATVTKDSFEFQSEMIAMLKERGVDVANMKMWIEHHKNVEY